MKIQEEPVVRISERPVLLLHGGTGSLLEKRTERCVTDLLSGVRGALLEGVDALSLAFRCVSWLEESGLFNAGRGAIPQSDGVVRRDAGAMDGNTLDALGISQVEGIPGMSRLLGALLGKSPHVHLRGSMVFDWALRHGFRPEGVQAGGQGDPTLIWDETPGQAGGGTVGCVVRDRHSNLASVTSTGGIGQMWPGRIGDTPVVGGGFYAENGLGAISMTGTGESILKSGGGLAILNRLLEWDSKEEMEKVIFRFLESMKTKFGGTAGCVGVASSGRAFVAHSTPRMLYGAIGFSGEIFCSDRGDVFQSGLF